MELRPVTLKDTDVLNAVLCKTAEASENRKAIEESVNRLHGGRYYEMFLVFQKKAPIGVMTVYGHTDCIVNINAEITESERHKGYGFEAMIAMCSLMYEKGYTIAIADIDADNIASVKLHEKLGFERERTYLGSGGKKFYLYIRTLSEFGEI